MLLLSSKAYVKNEKKIRLQDREAWKSYAARQLPFTHWFVNLQIMDDIR